MNPLKASFEMSGQAQVFRFWDGLDAPARLALLADAAEIDLEELAALSDALLPGKTPAGPASADMLSGLSPAPFIPLPESGGDPAEWARAREAGEEALAAGKVACFVVAGGQGTRLGYDGPKGCYPATPVRRASLFQVFAEKIRAATKRYGKPIPWMVMTSDANDAATRRFFAENAFFGLPENDVIFFRQGRMPAVDSDGRILLASASSIALSPNGHGGSLRAVVQSGAAKRLEEAGIDIVSYWQVDNPLVKVIDPAFIGFHALSGSEMSSKMIPKAYPLEKVGHFCLKDGKYLVIEYSDLPAALQEERDASGALRFLAGSVAIHLFDRRFIEKMGGTGAGKLPFHIAHKKIETVDEAGAPVKPDKPNGYKFEMFVFDALPFAKNPVIIEGRRGDEFSPIKNAGGVDSPESCRRDQLLEWQRWADAAKVALPGGRGDEPPLWEVTPLFADNESEFLLRAKSGEVPAIAEGTVLQ
ncbi:MAG TPA: UDPGP type 1 family protein [Opitutales bacterium]|nr:UDPGP type 1 family protein [Opitutales bacterium]